jgi:hypothetical protein
VIKADTRTQARLAKDYRNLIHPGRAARLTQKCDRGTALVTVAAVELVIRDLTLSKTAVRDGQDHPTPLDEQAPDRKRVRHVAYGLRLHAHGERSAPPADSGSGRR